MRIPHLRFGRPRPTSAILLTVATLAAAWLSGPAAATTASPAAPGRPAAQSSARTMTSGATTAAVTPNGLAATPPMGWNTWYGFHCGISAQLVEQTALAMVRSGMKAAGYKYVTLDDCWEASQRSADGSLQADPTKFPDGIKAVADYVHSLGLKIGIYESVGTSTCAGYPGSYGHYQQDADTFASWGIDFVKLDWCSVPTQDFPGLTQEQVAQTLYTQYAQALQATGRPMVLSISASNPALQPWTWAPAIGNMWRTNADYGDTWGQILGNLDQEAPLARYAGPGHWNDPDVLQIGLGGTTTAEDQAQFSMWAMLAAPLLAGNDLRSMSAATRAILTNREVIAIDQDPLGAQATRLSEDGNADVWVKPLADGDRAVMLLNRGSTPLDIATTAQAAGLRGAGAYSVRNLWTHRTSESAGLIAANVPADSAVLYRVAPLRGGVGRYPPSTDVSVTPQVPPVFTGSTFEVAAPGQTLTVGAAFRNDARQAVTRVSLALTAPEGWDVSGTAATARALATGQQVDGSWQVTVPADAAQGSYLVTGTARYRWGRQAGISTGEGGVTVLVLTPGDLSPFYNNVGITDDSDPGPGSFDGAGDSYSAEALADAGLSAGSQVTAGGVTFTWPDVPAGQPDNVILQGQSVVLSGSGSTLGFLGAAAGGTFSGTGTIVYTDGSTQPFTITFTNWIGDTPAPGGLLVAHTAYFNRTSTGPARTPSIFAAFAPLDPSKTLAGVILPSQGDMHVFALGVG